MGFRGYRFSESNLCANFNFVDTESMGYTRLLGYGLRVDCDSQLREFRSTKDVRQRQRLSDQFIWGRSVLNETSRAFCQNLTCIKARLRRPRAIDKNVVNHIHID